MANTTDSGGIWTHPALMGTRMMFYALSPAESSYENLKDVPSYVNKAVPFFFSFIIFETIINYIKGHKEKIMRPNDAFSSVAAGLFSQLPLLLTRNIELTFYMYIYENYRLAELPWDSAWTWWVAMFGVDCGYYWVHRFAHEVNFMWAAHQVHHSSEDYNLTTALRQSLLQRYSSWMFYLPMAFFVPPQAFLVHVQLNLIYQFWIHTDIVHKLGPLEWILNTPSHHRVHHGRNRYCIDKNYAGVLIIWDRMFGTFVAEDDNDTIAYGLVHPLKSWDIIYTQFCHWKYILRMASKRVGLSNKLSTFLKGPGWAPGKPRMGYSTDIPDIHGPQKKYNKSVSKLFHVYLWAHFFLALIMQQELAIRRATTPFWLVMAVVLFLIWTITNIGHIYEHKPHGPYLELLRCVSYLAMDTYLCNGGVCGQVFVYPRAMFFASAAFWLLYCGKHLGEGSAAKKHQ